MEDLALFSAPQLRFSAHIISIQHSAKFALCNSQLLGKDKEEFYLFIYLFIYLFVCLYPFQHNSNSICVKSFQIFDKNTLL